MKKRIKSIVIALSVVLVVSFVYALNPTKAEAKYDEAEICRMYVPRANACMWHPINCSCDIIITP